ncbi:MAG: hypothetical protein GC168_15735 [Candidatus Hydrogenedens sp.]|nr:hypothetical protein [Candidatus Hydrogenedens sp.]
MEPATPMQEEEQRDAAWRALWMLAFMALGLVARFAEFLHYRVLWQDESYTGYTIVSKSFAEFFQPLGLYQIVPPVYLSLVKACTLLAGVNEYAARFPSLVAGVASLFMFYLAARRMLTRRGAAFAFAFFASSGLLIYYANELKPYSSDVLVSVSLWWLAHETARRPRVDWDWAAKLGLAGAAAVWLSFPSCFVLAGIGAYQLERCARRRDMHRFTRLAAAYALWAASFAVLFLLILYPGMVQPSEVQGESLMDTMQGAWSFGFLPFPPKSAADLQLYENQFFRLFYNPAGFRLTGLAAFLVLVGWGSLYRRDNRLFWLLLNPVIVVFAVSLLKLYPFDGRMILFLLPACYMALGEGIAYLSRNLNRGALAITLLALGMLLLPPTARAAKNIVAPPPRYELDTALRHIEEEWQDTDLLFLGFYDRLAFEFCQGWHHFPEAQVLSEPRPLELTPDGESVFETIPQDQLSGRRIWVAIDHHRAQEKLKALIEARGGRPLPPFELGGAKVFGFQFD